jgi:protein-tyrosine sulfotransferase
MKAGQLTPAAATRSATARPGAEGRAQAQAPVVVLTYANAGAGRLHSLLARNPGLACTSGTGLLPLCERALRTWQQVEERDVPSALALASVRALAGTVITLILAREGRPRWCEIASAPPACAEAFLRVYPDTRFLCLYRHCADVIQAAARADLGGSSDYEFGPFTAADPGHTTAVLAAYWAARTEPMLAFEAAHADACLRVRYEDVVRDPGLAASEIFAFLGLEPGLLAVPAGMDDDARLAGPPVSVGELPAGLGAQVNDLLNRLSYPPMA